MACSNLLPRTVAPGKRQRAGRPGLEAGDGPGVTVLPSLPAMAPTPSLAGALQDRFHATAGKLAQIHGSWKMQPKAEQRRTRGSVASTTRRIGDGILTLAATDIRKKVPQAAAAKAHFRPIPANQDVIARCWRGQTAGTVDIAAWIDQLGLHRENFSGLLRQPISLHKQSYPIQYHCSLALAELTEGLFSCCVTLGLQAYQAACGQGLATQPGRPGRRPLPSPTSGGTRPALTWGAMRHGPVFLCYFGSFSGFKPASPPPCPGLPGQDSAARTDQSAPANLPGHTGQAVEFLCFHSFAFRFVFFNTQSIPD